MSTPIIPRDQRLELPAAATAAAAAAADDGATVTSTGPTCTGAVSVLSWNILADSLLQKSSHVPAAERVWAGRRNRIVAELLHADPDIVCLQEVDQLGYDEIAAALAPAGFAGLRQHKASDYAGQATFWRGGRFALAGAWHRSRSMTVVLSDRVDAGRELAIVNVHLEGHPAKSVARVKQLQTTLKELASAHSHHGVVIAGDFNCQLRSSACGAYLAFGSVNHECTPLEWGREVPAEVSNIPGHGYQLAAACCERGLDRFSHFTYAQRPGRPEDGLDQIWHSTQSLAFVGERAVFLDDAQRLAILKAGLPSAANPSDHLPVGAIFRWTGRAATLADLKVPPPADPGPGPGDVEADPTAEAVALLAAAPLSQAQRETFAFVVSPVPGMPVKGKPPPEQLAQLKDRRERKAALLGEVSPAAKQMLDQVLRLLKQAAKSRKSK